MQDGHAVLRHHAGELRPDALELGADARGLLVDAVRLEVVAEQALPIRLLAVVQRVPVPVLDHVRAVGHVRPCLQPQLSVEGRVLARRVPADRLRVGLGDEIGRPLHRSREVTHERDPPAVEPLLRVVVGVDRGDVEERRDLLRVHRGARRAVEVLRDPLPRLGVLADQRRLPAEEVGDEPALVPFPLELPARGSGSRHAAAACPNCPPAAPSTPGPTPCSWPRRSRTSSSATP